MGGNNPVGNNPFRTGDQQTKIEPAQADAGAIVSTDETRNSDYASDFEQRLNQQNQGQSRKRILVIVAAVMGVLAVMAIGFLLLRTFNFGANSARRQNISQLKTEVNSLINLITNGEYKAEDTDSNSGDESELYIHNIIDASQDNSTKDRDAFFKDFKKSLKNIQKQLDENGGEMGLSDVSFQKNSISEINTVTAVLEKYASINYNDMDNFVDVFIQNGKDGVEDRLLNDIFSEATAARERLAGDDEGQTFIMQMEDNYRESIDYVSSKDELLTFVYYMNLDYAMKASTMLSLYQEGDCIQGETLDEVCRLNINNTEAGVNANKALIDTTEYMQESMNDWCESILRSMNNLKNELEEMSK